MKNIFLDTNIFISQNYLEGKYINVLLELGKNKEIKLWTHEIVKQEVRSNFEKHLKESYDAYMGFMARKSKPKYLRNTGFGKSVVNYKIPKLSSLLDEFWDEFTTRLKESNVGLIPSSQISSKSMLDDYFKSKAPFGKKEVKKHGFPDAFLIQFIKKWVKKDKINLTVLSKDEDFGHLDGYEGRVEVLEDEKSCINDLNAVLRDRERISKALEVIDSNKAIIFQEAKNYIKDDLLDDSIYWSYPEITEIYEVDELNFAPIEEFQVFIVEALNKEEIEAEISFVLPFSVKILTDDLSVYYYDSDDKMYYYPETTTVQVEGVCVVSSQIMAYVLSSDDYTEFVDIAFGREDFVVDFPNSDQF